MIKSKRDMITIGGEILHCVYGYDTNNIDFAFIAILNYNISTILTAENDVNENEQRLTAALESRELPEPLIHHLALHVSVAFEKMKTTEY